MVTINLPDNLESIEHYAFSGCGLQTIDLPNNLKSIGGDAFLNCDLESVNLPDSLISIGGGAFKNCHLLRFIELPRTLNYIGEEAFMKCPLESIEIPSEVNFIGKGAFSYCNRLQTIYFTGLIPPESGLDVFKGNNNVKAYVPYNKAIKYEEAFYGDDAKIVKFRELNVESMVLDKKNGVFLEKDETIHLSKQCLPKGSNTEVCWSSSDETIATVDNEGKVTAIKNGKTTITCATIRWPEVKSTCNVLVGDFPEISLKDYDGTTYNVGEKFDVEAKPEVEYIFKNLVWTISNPNIEVI